MTYTVPPLKLPGSRALTRPITRPFNLDRYAVLGLLPEINTKWIDYSDKSNHGTLHGPTLVDSGRYGPALKFDGTNDYVSVTENTGLRFTTAFSISFWCKRLGDSSDTYAVLIMKADTITRNNYMIFWMDTGEIKFNIRDATNNANRSSSIDGYAETGIWRHLCGVFDGTDLNIYVDGVVGTSDEMEGTPHTGAEPIEIGRLPYAVGNRFHFNGLIDEIIIFNRGLKLYEIQAITNMGKSP